MTEPDRREQTDERPIAQRRRLGLFVTLLVLTIAGGVAARVAGGSAAPDPVAGGPGSAASSADPDGSVRIGARLDRTRVLQDGDGLVRLELTITGAAHPEADRTARTPTDLIVVLDRSGSMQGAPITHALASVRRLIDSLEGNDRFALVTYASSARTDVALAPATPQARRAWSTSLSNVDVSGGTNMSSGLDRANAEITRSRLAGRSARVVLISDGHANEGDHTREGLVSRAARAVAGEYVVSAVGVGEGFDESLMTALADSGTGNFYFVQRGDDLGDVFAGEFASARSELASGLKVGIRPEPGVEVVSAAGYPLSREGDRVVFRPGSLFSGQARRIWVTFRMPTRADETSGIDTLLAIGTLSLDYVRDGAPRTLALADVPRVEVVRNENDFLAGLDEVAWADSVVEEELGALKQSVSSALQRGDADTAKAELDSFQRAQRRINAVVASPAVTQVLEDVAEMEAAVDRAETAQDSAERNRLSKQYSAEGHDGRRPGAKYEQK